MDDFKPFVWVHTEDGAHSFLTALGERKLKTLRLPDGIDHLSFTDQLPTVKSCIQQHYRETTGRFVGFGAILRYRFANTFDTSVVLDTSGNVLDRNGGRFLLPEVYMALG